MFEILEELAECVDGEIKVEIGGSDEGPQNEPSFQLNRRNLAVAVVTGTYIPETHTILLTAVCEEKDIIIPRENERQLETLPRVRPRTRHLKEPKSEQDGNDGKNERKEKKGNQLEIEDERKETNGNSSKEKDERMEVKTRKEKKGKRPKQKHERIEFIERRQLRARKDRQDSDIKGPQEKKIKTVNS